METAEPAHTSQSAQSAPTTSDRSWILDSPFFDPKIMDAAALQQRQDTLRCYDAPLHCIEKSNGRVSSHVLDSLSTIQGRAAAKTRLDATDPELRIFLFEYSHYQSRQRVVSKTKIGLDKNALSWFLANVSVHPSFLEMLNCDFGIVAVHGSFDKANKLSHTHFWFRNYLTEDVFYSRYDVESRAALLVIGTISLEGHVLYWRERLEHSVLAQHPFQLACWVLDLCQRRVEDMTLRGGSNVAGVAQQTGRTHPELREAGTQSSPGEFNLPIMYRCADDVDMIVQETRFFSKLAKSLSQEHRLYLERISSSSFDRRKLTGIEHSIHSRLLSLEDMFESMLSHAIISQQRLQRQLVAADAIINQYDSKLNLENAKSNLKIADSSKRIAEETRRDSTSMKTIATLGMIYLPSSFVATLFSTGFFSYETNSGQMILRVHTQIWKLAVVALALSFLTVATWIWVNKFGIPKWLGWARQNEKPKDEENEASNGS